MGRLIFITQSYRPDDTIVGVVRDWVRALAERCDGVDVVALSADAAPRRSVAVTDTPGRGSVPAVRAYSLGKDAGAGRAAQVVALYRALAATLPRASAVLVHMVPRYALLALPAARLARRPVALWYAQGGVNRALRLAAPRVDHILTPSRDSFPLSGTAVERRIRVTGHGIDTRRYAPDDTTAPEPGTLLAAGRLSRSKRYDRLFDALERVRGDGWRLRIASGSRYAADTAYESDLHRQMASPALQGKVSLVGAVAYDQMPAAYRAAWLFAHTSGTGSLDKVVLEALACGTPAVSTAPTAQAVLRPVSDALCPADTPDAIAAALESALVWSRQERQELASALRQAVVRDHSLDNWADRVTAILSGPAARA